MLRNSQRGETARDSPLDLGAHIQVDINEDANSRTQVEGLTRAQL